MEVLVHKEIKDQPVRVEHLHQLLVLKVFKELSVLKEILEPKELLDLKVDKVLVELME